MTADLTPPADLPLPFSAEQMTFSAGFEQGPHGGPALVAYRCPAGVWTFAFGETEAPDGGPVRPGMTCTPRQAWELIAADMAKRKDAVLSMCTIEPGPNELFALVDLAYTIGLRDDKEKTGLFYSGVLKAHNRGNGAAAAEIMLQYDKAHVNGVLTELPGLKRRRHGDAGWYLMDAARATAQTPQVIATPPTLVASPTMATATGGSVITGAALAAKPVAEAFGFTSMSDALDKIPAWAHSFGFEPWQALCGGAFAALSLIAYRRWSQRDRGVA